NRKIEMLLAHRLQRLPRGCVAAGRVALGSKRVAHRAHLCGLIVDDQQLRFVCRVRIHQYRCVVLSSDVAAAGCACPLVDCKSARVRRSSGSFGGLLKTTSTCSGTDCSVLRRWPQPASKITGVRGESFLTAAATLRP